MVTVTVRGNDPRYYLVMAYFLLGITRSDGSLLLLPSELSLLAYANAPWLVLRFSHSFLVGNKERGNILHRDDIGIIFLFSVLRTSKPNRAKNRALDRGRKDPGP